MAIVNKINSISISTMSKLQGVSLASIGKVSGVNRTSNQPSIITTNLIQHLDASNSTSYPGSGTTWSDLSSEGHDLTLINSPTYTTSDVGGEFYFDGVDESARIEYDDASGLRIAENTGEVNAVGASGISRTYNDIASYGGLTIQAWVKPLSFTGTPPTEAAQHEAVLIFANNGHVSISEVGDIYRRYYQGIEFVLGRNSNLVLFEFGGNGGNASTNRKDVRTIDNFLSSTSPGIGDYVDSWVNIAVTINGETVSNETTMKSEIKFYIQGQPVASSYIRAWSDYNEGTGPGIGYRSKYSTAQSEKYHAGTALRRGVFARQSMSHLLQYNDILTDAEIEQNYDATKTRHGY